LKFLQVALGILSAIGGFVDIGDLVFATSAGALFGFQLCWAVVVGVIGIVLFAEMSGRVATVTQRPVFSVVRQRMGFGLALTTLIGSAIVNLLTLAAEAGGIALVISLFLNVSYAALIPLGFLILGVVMALAFQLDRADLRLHGALPDRLPGGRVEAPPRLGHGG
jgi:Mn2+/Fe2+ NRAMP family transporter